MVVRSEFASGVVWGVVDFQSRSVSFLLNMEKDGWAGFVFRRTARSIGNSNKLPGQCSKCTTGVDTGGGVAFKIESVECREINIDLLI